MCMFKNMLLIDFIIFTYLFFVGIYLKGVFKYFVLIGKFSKVSVFNKI